MLVQSNLDIKVTQLDSEVILILNIGTEASWERGKLLCRSHVILTAILNMGTEASWERGKLLCRSHVILTAMHIKQVYHV